MIDCRGNAISYAVGGLPLENLDYPFYAKQEHKLGILSYPRDHKSFGMFFFRTWLVIVPTDSQQLKWYGGLQNVFKCYTLTYQIL